MNLDFAKVCGKHSAIYEAYYKQIDPKASGAIEAMTAAKFLKKSGLSDVVLSRVWDLSDPNGKGFLDKPGFFVALKLVSLAQAGQVINMSNIYSETANPPKVGDIPKIMPARNPVPTAGVVGGDWSISVIDRLKYEQLFESLKPVANMLPGNKVKGVLLESKLPMDILGKIWDLADQDKDGNLDKHEFIVAMHLVYQTLEKRTVPDVLPPELRKPSGHVPPPKPAPPVVAAAAVPRAPSGEGFGDGGFVANFPKDIAPPPAIPPLPLAMPPMGARVPPVGAAATQPLISTDPLIQIGAPPSVSANAEWVVGAAELKRFEVMFRESDRDMDGLVSGLEVKNIFLQSGVPQQCLAHIWALCDTNQSGKLALEQFALAMWMVERKQKGIEPPQVMTANMVPPSMRGIISGVELQPQAEPKPTYSNPELEMISKEIEELAKERRTLETEIAQKEADVRIKSGEVRSLQSELDTLSATLKQLENQRGEAQKRLDDLKAQVNKIREQCQKQEETINEQEGEINAKRSELQKLKDEETALQKEYDANNRELQNLTKHLQNTQLQISSVRSMVTELLETQRQMTDALLMCRAAIESQDGELVTEYQLKIEPDFDEARKVLEKKIEEPKDDDPFGDNKNTSNNGFGSTSNGFASDPFASAATTTNNRTGFDDSFSATSGFDSGFDAFGGSAFGSQQKDPFGADAFGANKTNSITPEPGKDDFGSDPFAALHAPTGQGQVLSPNTQKSGPPPRPESPSPALPPKKSKVPPPRPAPPRPNQGPARPAQPAMDAFGGMSSGVGGFADFADFDNKQAASVFNSNSLPSKASGGNAAATASSSGNLSNMDSNHANSSSVSNISSSSNSINRNTPIIIGPTDFADDPFKNYRYEDPFSIKDPFEDDEIDPDKIFKDDLLSSDDDEKKLKDVAAKSSVFNAATAKSNTPLSNEFLDRFSDFNINPSPVPSQKSSITAYSSSKSQSNTPLPVSSTASTMFADFDAFSSKSSASTNGSTNAINTASGKLNNNANALGKSNNDDSFFDAFNNDDFELKTANSTKSANNNNAFAAFGVGNSFAGSDAAAYDAFGVSNKSSSSSTSNAKSTKLFDDDDDFGTNSNFDDIFKNNINNNITVANAFTTNANQAEDFFKMALKTDVTKQEGNANNSLDQFSFPKATANNSNNISDIKFDAFGSDASSLEGFKADFNTTLNNSINFNLSSSSATSNAAGNKLTTKVQNSLYTLSKTPNTASTSAANVDAVPTKLPAKFAGDYSNADSFDADLEEALKRSMIDQ